MSVYIDCADHPSAIVLAGSAEDVLQGLLEAQSPITTPVRAQMAASAKQIAASLDPTSGRVSENETTQLMRTIFN